MMLTLICLKLVLLLVLIMQSQPTGPLQWELQIMEREMICGVPLGHLQKSMLATLAWLSLQ